jgi:hypothetical protein
MYSYTNRKTHQHKIGQRQWHISAIYTFLLTGGIYKAFEENAHKAEVQELLRGQSRTMLEVPSGAAGRSVGAGPGLAVDLPRCGCYLPRCGCYLPRCGCYLPRWILKDIIRKGDMISPERSSNMHVETTPVGRQGSHGHLIVFPQRPESPQQNQFFLYNCQGRRLFSFLSEISFKFFRHRLSTYWFQSTLPDEPCYHSS